MKKLLILAMVLALSLSGCAFLQKVQGFVCNPTDQQKQEAAAFLTALDAAQAVAAMFYPPVAIAKASAVMTTISQGGCFLASEVETALNLLQETQTKQAGIKRFKAASLSVAQQFPALWAAVQRAKE